jgi:transcriptional regulator with XRE-family HTH domain
VAATSPPIHPGTSPTVWQWELGRRLRDLRNQRDLTVEDVAAKLLCSATKISRLETAARRPSLRDVRDLCDLYDVGESVKAELMSLAQRAREPGWWTKYADLNLEPYIGLEPNAKSITCYSMYYVPALLQTKEYAQEIIKAIARKMDPAIHQERVEARMRRQQLLEPDNRPRYHALMDEAVLHRPVGGPDLMAAQLERIILTERAGKAVIQVVPFGVGAHPAAECHFVLLEEFEDSKLSPVVFLEGLTRNQHLESPAEIDRYRECVEYLCEIALSPADSIKLIDRLRKDFITVSK